MQHKTIIVIFMSVVITNMFCGAGKICRSMDIRNSNRNLLILTDCEIITGYLQIVLIPNKTNEWDTIPTFPKLREITHYLLFYRVGGLENIGRLFPNLVVIRGQELFMNYALVIYEMANLNELGLNNLTFLQGSARIQDNPFLCAGSEKDMNVTDDEDSNVVSMNKPPEMCTENNQTFCSWCKKNTVDSSKCHKRCAGGCYKDNDPGACHSCRSRKNNGVCVEKCPPKKYILNNYLCVTKEECLKYFEEVSFPYKGKCLLSCPPNYVRVDDEKVYCEKCNETCPKICKLSLLSNVASARRLKGCTHINGSLEIRLQYNRQVVKELYSSLDSITEITGGLLVYRSFYLQSLDFLKNLTLIRGKNVSYSIRVYENSNLETLFNWTTMKHLRIEHGNFSFHYNPKLCFSEIEKLRNVSGMLDNFTHYQISPYSNGDKVACNYESLNASAFVQNSTSVKIKWERFQARDIFTMIGYLLYYTSTRERTLSRNNLYEACDQYGWQIETIFLEDYPIEPDVYEFVVTNLRPYTLYGFFVRTHINEKISSGRMTSSIGGQSSIMYVETQPYPPSRPTHVIARNLSHSSIYLEWELPDRLNGKLSRYEIFAYLERDRAELVDQRNYCAFPMVSDLLNKRPVSSDPHDEEFDCDCEDTISTCMYVEHKMSIECTDLISELKYMSEMDILQRRKSEELKRNHKGTINETIVQTNFSVNKTKIVDGFYEIYHTFVPASNTEHIIPNLINYGMYIFHISACNEGAFEDELCGPTEIVTHRTSPKIYADIPIKFKILEVTHNSVTFSWREPKRANSIIVNYYLEYVLTGNTNIQPVIICITRKQHNNSGGVYVKHGIAAGSYKARIKATSLAMTGPYTSYVRFKIEDKQGMKIILGVIILCPCISAVIIYFAYFKTRKSNYNSYADGNIVYYSEDYVTDIGEYNEILPRNVSILDCNLKLPHVTEIVCKVSLHPTGTIYFAKINKLDASRTETKKFFQEIDTMKEFNSPFIAKLSGIISVTQPQMVLYEYCSEGNLNEFLNYYFHKGETIPYRYMFKWAAEIADGMAYFSGNNQIHGDLASRNIYLTRNFTAKIINFGIGQIMNPEDYCDFSNTGHRIPIRWMPKELLETFEYTVSSDIWSYGIVLWEIGTLGRKPYAHMTDEEAIMFICSGGEPSIPADFPHVLSKIVRKCFQKAPRRPQFNQIVKALEPSLDDEFKKLSFTYHLENLKSSDPLGLNVDTRNYERINKEFQIRDQDWFEWKNHLNGTEFLRSRTIDISEEIISGVDREEPTVGSVGLLDLNMTENKEGSSEINTAIVHSSELNFDPLYTFQSEFIKKYE